MEADKRICAMVSDYRLEHGSDPRRITVSVEVARKLEAIFDARRAFCEAVDSRPVRLREGHQLIFQGIPVVADLDDEHIVDIR